MQIERFKIEPTHPDAPLLSGKYNAEFVHVAGGYVAHLAPAYDQPEGAVAHRWARAGDIVVERVSQAGFYRISDAVSKLSTDDQCIQGKVLDAIIQLDFITWDRPMTGR